MKAFIKDDRQVTMEDISQEFQVSDGTVRNILHDNLGLVKKAAQWVLKMLRVAHKMERVRCAQAFLKSHSNMGKTFLEAIVTMDENSISFYTPETKEDSKQWLPKGARAPVKFKN